MVLVTPLPERHGNLGTATDCPSRSTMTMATLIGPPGSKAEALEQMKERQRAFLKRKSDDSKKSFRPTKIHRKSALQWLASVDNQFRMFAEKGVLIYSQPADEGKRAPALSWPRVSASPDLGSDGVSALSFWIHELRGGIGFSSVCSVWCFPFARTPE